MSPRARPYVDALIVAATREADPDAIARRLRLACRRAKAGGADVTADPAVRLLTACLARVVNAAPLPADYTALAHACHDRAAAD